MTITAAELRAIGNERTGRAETQDSIDKFIKSWVADLTDEGIELEAEEEVSFVDSQSNYIQSALTNNFKRIKAITVEDTDGNESRPLDEISWQRYKERVSQSVADGKPREYARFNETIFVWPPPDADAYPLMNVSGSIYHADSTTIVYPNRFRECGIQYVIFKIYEKYGQAETTGGKTAAALYVAKREQLLQEQSTKKVSRVRYSDI